ncbi:MAG: hypothetical protein ACTTHX_07015 [Moraxella sp.]
MQIMDPLIKTVTSLAPNFIHLPKPLCLSCDLDGHKIDINSSGRGHGIIYISLTPETGVHDAAYLEVCFEFWSDIRLIDDEYSWHGTYAQIDDVYNMHINNITVGDCLHYQGDLNNPTIKQIITKFIYTEGENWLNENFDRVFDDSGKVCFALCARN